MLQHDEIQYVNKSNVIYQKKFVLEANWYLDPNSVNFCDMQQLDEGQTKIGRQKQSFFPKKAIIGQTDTLDPMWPIIKEFSNEVFYCTISRQK